MMFSNENTTRTVTAEEIGTWRVQELRNFCKEHKIRGYSKLRKAELVALVTDFVGQNKGFFEKSDTLNPAPLSDKLMQEYIKRKKLAEEKEVLRCWEAVLITLLESGKSGELVGEISTVKKNIRASQRRITELETLGVATRGKQCLAFVTKAILNKKHRKAA